jgi:hypothetical protein
MLGCLTFPFCLSPISEPNTFEEQSCQVDALLCHSTLQMQSRHATWRMSHERFAYDSASATELTTDIKMVLEGGNELQVERRIDENDMMVARLQDAVDVDRTLLRQACPMHFSLLPRRQRGASALSCERYMAATGSVVPPLSAFFHSQGVSPKPNAAAEQLGKLFWRNPAHARSQQPWKGEEDDLLKHGIAQIVLAARRLEAASKFRARMEALQGVGNALEEQRRALAEQSRDELGQLGVLEASGDGRVEAAVLMEAEVFSMQQWHAVSQHVLGRCERTAHKRVSFASLISLHHAVPPLDKGAVSIKRFTEGDAKHCES